MNVPGEPLPADFGEAIAAVRDGVAPLGDRILYFSTIGSTNDVALALAAGGGGDGTVVIAGQQTDGRGRRGRRWFSPPGTRLFRLSRAAPGAGPRRPSAANPPAAADRRSCTRRRDRVGHRPSRRYQVAERPAGGRPQAGWHSRGIG